MVLIYYAFNAAITIIFQVLISTSKAMIFFMIFKLARSWMSDDGFLWHKLHEIV